MNNVAYNHNTDKAVKGSGYGGLDATCGYLTNNITTTANTNLNGTTAITSKGNQEYYADTATNLKDNIYVLSVGGITDACAYNVINLTSNNTIKLADTASLLTKSENADIVLGANDRHEIVNNTITEAIGAVGVVVLAKNKNNITRNNTIDVSGIITSYHDVNMYAGKGSAGENGLLNLESNAEAYNKTGIPFGGHPSVTNTFNQTNTVKVNTSGSVAAVRNVNLYADAGKEVTDIFSEAYTSWGSKGGSNYVASTDGDKTIAGKTATNTVQVEGLVVAGAANVQNITIGLADTSRTDIVVLTSQEQYDAIYNYVQKNGGSMDKYVVYVAEKKAGDPDYYRTIDELITLTGDVNDSVYGIDNSVISSFVNVNEFKIGSRDYGLSILARMNELDTLMGNYADNPDSAAYKGFEAEYNTLKQRLTDAGVINSDGSLKTIVVSYVEVPNLSSHGGNVNVTTDNFYSSSQAGKVVAKGSPTITINNNTSLAMNINDVIVGDKGGQIIYNDKVMDPGTSTAIEDINAKLAEAIKTVNTDNSKTVTKAYSAVGGAGQITIKGNYNNTQGLNYLYTYVDKSDGETKTINDSMPVKADIIINGTVNANDGSVYIRSAYHDITIEGKSATDNNAVVTGKTVQLIADSGSVSQGYVDNIVNIGGNPHDQYESKTTGLNDGLNNISNSVYVSNSATVAGGSVIISAADINVNGTVQSGYEKYYVDISTDTALNKSDFDSSATGTITVAQRMQQIADNNGGRAISDEAVIGNPNYLLVAGSSVKRSDGSNIFDYRVAVYYNPSTDKILLPNVESKGGQVYLTGNISSTGNGQINCLDGASDITVNVNVNKELVVGDLITNDVTGTVRITDTNQRSIDGKNVSIVTEYTRNDDGTVNAVSKYLSDKEYVELTAAQMEALGITSSSYAPKEGLRYNWTGGSKTSSYQIYRATWYNKWWGASSSKSEYTKYLAENESTAENLVSSGSSTDPKSRGDFIGTVDGYTFNNNSDVYDIIWQHKDGTSTTEIIKHREWSQGYLNCHHYTEDTWKVSTSGTIDTYTYSVKADQKIGINFIGHADGASEVRVTSAQNDITLTGNLGNVTLYENKDNAGNLTGYAEKGTVNITANNASISQTGGSIYGERVNLLAKENIENIDLTLGDAMKLEVKNIASVTADGKTTTTPNDTEQDISITAHSNKQAAGNLIISKIGSVNITADGETMAATTNKASITNLGNTGNILTTEDGIIVADRIDLVSQNGSIDVRVRAAQESYNADPLTASINATAQKDITLTQIGVDDIAGGNMRIGTIYAKDGDVTINVADGSVVDALPYNDLASASENTLIKKWLQAGLIDDDKASAEAQAQSTALQAEKTLALQDTEEVIALRRSLNDKNTELTKYQKQQALCESDPEKYAEYSGAATKVAEINSEITQLNTQISQLTQDAGTYETWSKEALLYSIQNSIINPESGDLPTTSSKAPNVRGNNITLNVKDSAGVLDANTIEMTIDTLGNANVTDEKSGMTGMEDLKLLSQTDASNVVWNSNTGIITINKKLPIGVQLNAPGKDEQGNDTAIGKIIVANFENTDKNVAGDIYLEGRVNPAATEEKNVTKDINIGLLAAEGDVSVTSLGKITHEPAVGDAANIYGKSLYIAAAEGSIGELDNSLLVVLNGGNKSLGLSAIAPDGIYIRDIGAYYSDADNALWLKNISTQGNIEIAADKSIYQLTNDADIPYYLRIEESDSEESHSITLVSESGNVGQAVKDADGKVKYDDEGFPILTSYTETDADGNEVTKQSEAIHILNSNNAVIVRAAQNVYVEGITSSNDKDQPAEGVLKLTVTSSKKDTDGNYLNLENVGVYVNGELKLAGDINANDTISLDTVKALTIDEGDALTAATIKIRSQESVTTESKLTATNDVVMVAGTDLTVNDVVQAGNDVTLKADDNIYVYSEIGADNDAMLTAGDKITTNAEITAGNDAILEAEKEILVQKAITATGDVEIESAAASI
ncbi:MAG: hypothetical protein Q4D21_01835, partial [Phascolarctobacterium sp.]|nr:hypothetical protein [Phascolarctobacterium sp.]